MSFSRRFELLLSPLVTAEMELPELDFTLDVLSPSLHSKYSFFDSPLLHFHCFDSWGADLTAAARRAETEIQLQSLSTRVAALEAGFERALGARTEEAKDRKFKWTAEIKGAKGEESQQLYKVVAEAKASGERRVKWTKNVKGKGRYTFETSTKSAATGEENANDRKGDKKKKDIEVRKPVEIKEVNYPGAIHIKKAFSKRALVDVKGKRKELSPQDAAMIIQGSFRAYLIRRSQVLHGLRDLAVAKAKLKEIRSNFNNLSYRQHIGRDIEERQRFTEKIIVLLLTVEAIQGSDYMIRAAKKSIIDELEIKLEVVDPQQPGGLGSSRRRKFDLPESVSIGRELARSVAQVVQMIDEHDDAAVPGTSA
ncbi:BAG family molecular chaperone regulator 7 [Platanthera guangdongensis]|uniref:BAG family molecular chaperone regulator 7 n=1 Tax=Platanthera guangdongensis TaxID=2320717 RepID=A0ABR2MED6_9ASPA